VKASNVVLQSSFPGPRDSIVDNDVITNVFNDEGYRCSTKVLRGVERMNE
jgi:hypothetical protein